MLGRAERHGVLDVVRLAHPDHRQRRLARQGRDEPLGHHAVAGTVAGDVEPIGQRHAPRPIAAGAVVEMAMPVRVMRVGRPWRDVAEDDRPAMAHQPLRHRRHRERSTGHRAPVLQKLGPRRKAAGRHAGGDDARRRGKHRTMGRKARRLGGKGGEAGHVLGCHAIPADPIENDDNGPRHGDAPLLRPARDHRGADDARGAA